MPNFFSFWWLILLVTAATPVAVDAIDKYNVTEKELQTCSTLELKNRGYMYRDFFHVNSLANNKRATEEQLHLRFYVKTTMDAHILLAPTNRPGLSDRLYEIVIGAGGNTFSTIRVRMGTNRVATNQEPRLLSRYTAVPIEVVQWKNGTLQVYMQGNQNEPLLQYVDKVPLKINYLSFSTYGPITAFWYYDCEFDGFAQEIEAEIRILTPQQRLIANLTAAAGGEQKGPPFDMKMVNFVFHIQAISYEASILQTRLNLLLFWQDDRLRWNPADYNGISALVLPDLDIWTPQLVVLNGAHKTLWQFNPRHELRLLPNGSVHMLATNAELTTWCINDARNWPNERLVCQLLLGLNDFSATDQLQLHYDSSQEIGNEPTINTLSEWQFIRLTVSSVLNGVLGRLGDAGQLRTTDGDLVIEFEVARNSGFYKNVFVAPILATHVLILLSFLLRGYRRGACILVVLVVIVMGLMFLTKHAPTHYVPSLMTAYQHVLRIATFCYLLHVCLMWLELYPPRSKPAAWFMSLLNATPLRVLLCLGVTNSEHYVSQHSLPWHEFAKLLNNLCFVLVNGYLVYVACTAYHQIDIAAN